jgi:rubrerythrin
MNSGHDETVALEGAELIEVLQQSLDKENDLLRTYVMTAERIHDDADLKERMHNFAEGNAKRTKQLIDVIAGLEEN